MNKWKIAGMIFAILFMLAACGSKEDATTGNTEEKETTDTPEVVEEGQPAYPMTVSPTVGSTNDEEKGEIFFSDITLEKMPEKIVVFDYGFLDTLDTLGVEGIVGIPKDSSLPAHLEKFKGDEYASVGSLKEPLLEDIAALDPDIIFISGRQSTFYEELSEIAPVLFIGTQQDAYWDTFLASVDTAAKIFGKEKEAEEYISKFDAALEEVNALAQNYDTSLVTMYNEGNLSGFASNSRFGYIYDIYGFKPVTEDIESSSHGSNFGFEAILEFNPQVLFVIDRTAATGGQSNIEADLENDIIKKTEAYQNNRIVYLDGALWYLSGGGLQSELAKIQEILDELK